MKYELDPRLLPPAGASVQCTRCSFVFTALPSGQVVVPNASSPAGDSARGEVSRTSTSNTTRIFGTPYVSGQQGERGSARPASPRGKGSTQAQGAPDLERTPAYGTEAGPPGEGASAAAPTATGKTQVFGAAGARPPPPSATTTQVFGAVNLPPTQDKAPSPATTQVFGSASVAAAQAKAPSASTTQVFGSASLPSAQSKPPSASTTQVFGAVNLPPEPAKAPSASTTQVFGSASVPSVPARTPTPATTQVFGSASVPQAQAKAPAATTTQVFGAVSLPTTKPSSPVTTQVFGSSSVPATPPSPATTQTFGSGAIRAAEKAAGRSAPSGGSADAAVPWMAEPAAPPSAPRGVTRERRAVASPAAPVALPPEEPVALPTPTPVPLPASGPVSQPLSAPVALPPEPLPERSGVTGSSRRLPAFDQAPEVFDRIEQEGPSRQRETGGRERLLIILAAVVVLGLTGWLTYPSWRNRGAELPPEAVRAKEEAVALLRRDDAASREQAFARLRPLVAQYPKYTEAQAELGVALALQLDDAKAELEWLGEQEARLRKEVRELQVAQAPADWSNRVNVGRAELENLGHQRPPLEATVSELTKQVESAQRIIRAAPETEPAADVVARLKAQAVYAGVTGNPQALVLAERLRKVESPAHWSAISLAEYGLNARSDPKELAELSLSLQKVRERDTTFIRAYVLGARLALRQKDPATARTLLDTVEALNPNHELARKLRTWAASTVPAP
jgi:hypothetical protein